MKTSTRMMMRVVALVLPLMVGFVAEAQVKYPNEKLLRKGDYAKMEAKVRVSLSANPTALDHYAAYKLYAASGYGSRNTDSAFVHLVASRDAYTRLETKERDKMEKSGLTQNQYYEDFMVITEMAISEAELARTEEACVHFLEVYHNEATPTQVGRAEKTRDRLAFEKAKKEHTVGSYERFLALYPKAEQVGEARRQRNALAYDKAKETNTLEGYTFFLERYPEAEQAGEVKRMRNALAYDKAVKSNTEEGYRQFLKRYPDAEQVGDVSGRLYKLAYDKARKEDQPSSYATFIDLYPQAPQVGEARSRMYVVAYEMAEKEHTEEAMRRYASRYPQSPNAKKALAMAEQYAREQEQREAEELQAQRIAEFERQTTAGNWRSYRNYIYNHSDPDMVELASERICELGKKSHDLDLLDYAVRNLDGPAHDTLSNILLGIYLDESYLSNFVEKYGEYTSEEMDERIEEMERVYYSTDDTAALRAYVKAYAPFRPAYIAVYWLIEKDIEAKRWKTAYTKAQRYAEYFGDDPTFSDLLATLGAPDEKDVRPTKLSANVNTVNGEEYVPVISADGSKLYFCGQYRKDNIWGEDIFVSSRTGKGPWGKAKLVKELSGNSNESPLSISSDGSTMLLFVGGEIYSSDRDEYGWSEPDRLSSTINSADWQADAMITSDGSAMLFSARKQTPHELNESINIYVSLRQHGYYGDYWGDPIDLGPVVNTPGTDRSPFLHPDMKTLYFASDRHSSLGGSDVFMCTRLSEESWTEWSEPVNLGKEINTTGREWGYQISTDGTTAYYAKDDGKGQDLYSLTLPVRMRPNMVATVEGKLLDYDKKPVSANIRWEDLQSHKDMGSVKSDPADGSFFIVLPLGKNYGYYVDANGYFPASNNLDLTQETKAVTLDQDIPVYTFDQMVENNLAVPINNLFFDSGKWSLKSESYSELKRVAAVVKGSNLKVEIAGHTDNVGDDDMNQTLSEKRAASVRDYLVKECGCPEDRLISVGFGETKPVATNDTDKGRKQNRRVEMRFVK